MVSLFCQQYKFWYLSLIFRLDFRVSYSNTLVVAAARDLYNSAKESSSTRILFFYRPSERDRQPSNFLSRESIFGAVVTLGRSLWSIFSRSSQQGIVLFSIVFFCKDLHEQTADLEAERVVSFAVRGDSGRAFLGRFDHRYWGWADDSILKTFAETMPKASSPSNRFWLPRIAFIVLRTLWINLS